MNSELKRDLHYCKSLFVWDKQYKKVQQSNEQDPLTIFSSADFARIPNTTNLILLIVFAV